jgi:diacylglycerol kinase (ATP)
MPVWSRAVKLIGFQPLFTSDRVQTAKSVDVILNPASGGGAGRKYRAEIERELSTRGLSCRIHETSGPGAATRLSFELANRGATIVAAAGGDGTIHEVGNGLLQAGHAECALALIPLGTGNDFVKVVPGTRKRSAAYDTIARGTPQRFDVGRAAWDDRQEFFLNGMGTGVDVEVVRQLQSMPPLPGALKYLLALLRALVSYRPVDLAIQLDADQLRQRVMIVAVGNGVCQGGGFYLAPDASPRDGRLDVTLVRELSLVGMARVLPRILRGTQSGDPAVLMRTGQVIRFAAMDQQSLFFHLDGELREAKSNGTVEVRVLPSALSVMTAAS